MKRLKILVLTSRYPYPVIGGDRLRIFAICQELSKYHDLTLLTFCDNRCELEYKNPDDGVFKEIIKIRRSKIESVINVLISIFTKTPLQVAYYRSRRYKNKLNSIFEKFDISISHLIRTGQYVSELNSKKVLEMTDAISLNYERFNKVNHDFNTKILMFKIDRLKIKIYEKRMVDKFNVVSLISSVDKNYVEEGAKKKNIIVCTNGVNLDLFPFSDRINSDPEIVFIGNLNSVQNMDACLYFCREILPIIRRKIDVTFKIIGRMSDSESKQLRAFPGVSVCANVSNVADAAAHGRIAVAPVRVGAGVQNKVLEYMALGLPVVASSVALEGLSARPNTDLLVADRPEQFAESVLSLWNNLSLRTHIARSAAEYVQLNHSWTACLAPLVKEIDRLL